MLSEKLLEKSKQKNADDENLCIKCQDLRYAIFWGILLGIFTHVESIRLSVNA